MIIDLLKYISIPIRGYIKYADNVYSAAFKQSDGKLIYGPQNQEGKSISINDSDGTVIYTRITGEKNIKNQKRITSSALEFDIVVPCRLVFYSFEIKKDFSVDKIENHLLRVLKNVDFSHYIGTSKDIKLNVLKSGNDYEKIYNQETGKTFQSNDYPVIIAIDFEVSYKNTSCDDCDYSNEDTCLEYPIDPNLYNEYEVSFCEKVNKCSSIQTIQVKLISLQEQLDNLPPGFGCEDLPACQTIIDIEEEITDLSNKKLGLIKIIDLEGFFFTDLTSAQAYLRSMFTIPPMITNESYLNGVYYFTVPPLTVIQGYFLTDSVSGLPNKVSVVDEVGLLSSFVSGASFVLNSGNHILGNCYFCDTDFYYFSGTVYIKNILDIYTSIGSSFAEFSTGKFIIEGNIGSLETSQYSPFFRNSTSTIWANAGKYTSNAGGIHGDLQSAITNGANVFFDGIDKENAINKVINFNTPNHTTFATTQATVNLVDNRIQSNIKIIGDWDATSGSYPLADESNTTPFITQWGAIIKAGWAFRVGYGQAGTVDGFDYENGDVVYALIDNPTDNSSDWGDLDHNLQQANENIRGTAKIVTAVIVANETSTDDERIVSTKKLWQNFWTRVLAIAHTFAAKITFSTAPRFSSVTANHVLVVDGNKDLNSEAKGTAFNKNFGTTAGTVLEGNSLTNYLKKSGTISFTHTTLNPTSGNSYFFGTLSNSALNTTSTLRRGVAPFTGYVYSGSIVVQTSSTLGVSAGHTTLNLNNKTAGTSVVLSSGSIQYNVNCNVYNFELVTPFSVTGGDSLEIEINMPPFTTAPTSVIHFVNVNFGLK